MATTNKRLAVLCSGALLLACAGHGPRLPEAPGPQAAPGADAHYARARDAHLAGRLDEAAQAYAAALLADAGHVNARNGRATLLAEQGALDQAIPIWRKLSAAAYDADTAYLVRNLGYALLLQGDFDGARAALERACLLDPLNYRAWQQLGNALDKLGQPGRARQMAAQAAALQAHDFRAGYALAPRAGVAAIEQALQAGSGQWASSELRQRADGIYELHRIAAAPVAAATAPAALALLEIRNGNGVTGMARALSRTMDGQAVRVVRLSNQRGFGVRQTRIVYRAGYQAAAKQLARRFANPVLQEGDNGKASDLRLVIGRDLVAVGDQTKKSRLVGRLQSGAGEI